MRYSAIIGGTLVTVTLAQFYDFGFDIHGLVARETVTKRQSGNIVSVGQLPRRKDGSLPVRQELRHLQRNQYAWDLFILALSAMQKTDQNNALSWYQIAGVSAPSEVF